jgi:hypothetical protein
MISSVFVFLLSTVFLWGACRASIILIEWGVPNYWLRLGVMLLAGVGIGAFSASIGYSFFILFFILLYQVSRNQAGLLKMTGDVWVARKYASPMMLLIVAAGVGSYVFQIETCDAVFGCEPIFFERLYTPPHLMRPN